MPLPRQSGPGLSVGGTVRLPLQSGPGLNVGGLVHLPQQSGPGVNVGGLVRLPLQSGLGLSVGVTFQATAGFQDSDIFQKAIKMAARCILSVNSLTF